MFDRIIILSLLIAAYDAFSLLVTPGALGQQHELHFMDRLDKAIYYHQGYRAVDKPTHDSAYSLYRNT